MKIESKHLRYVSAVCVRLCVLFLSISVHVKTDKKYALNNFVLYKYAEHETRKRDRV